MLIYNNTNNWSTNSILSNFNNIHHFDQIIFLNAFLRIICVRNKKVLNETVNSIKLRMFYLVYPKKFLINIMIGIR